MARKNRKKPKTRYWFYHHPFFWLYLGFVILFTGTLFLKLNLAQAYIDTYPFNYYWKKAGMGHVTKQEMGVIESKGKTIVYYKYTFQWNDFESFSENRIGECYLHEVRYTEGDPIDVVI